MKKASVMRIQISNTGTHDSAKSGDGQITKGPYTHEDFDLHPVRIGKSPDKFRKE